MNLARALVELYRPTIPRRPDAAFLSKALRDRSLWPAGFSWDYRLHETCGMALAGWFWPFRFANSAEVNKQLGLPVECDIWCGAGIMLHKQMQYVTPEDLADLLDGAVALARCRPPLRLAAAA